ncbi:FixH family protein [Ferviditalea candida]|uniref:FixH family protein n=1 Tax=Ferviditalea candida TaxID=3108399 RepID=A0ABU5ZH95_9BACL|nr:FixH family protein [Paenibacillaceae bacterium T2]
MKKIFSALVALILLLTACAQKNSDGEHASHGGGDVEMLPIHADLQIPESVEPGAEVVLKVVVTQGNEKINDARQVEFEIWKGEDKDHSQMIPATNGGNGIYSAKQTFDTEGLYSVVSHVTARDMHTMPMKKITVGHTKPDVHESDHDHADNHHHGDVMIHFMKPDAIKVNEQAMMMVHLEKENSPLVKARVRLEIWQEGQEKHDWVDADETKDGQYQASNKFSKPGEYHIKVHVENDEGLHEHQEEKIQVLP